MKDVGRPSMSLDKDQVSMVSSFNTTSQAKDAIVVSAETAIA